MKLGEGGRKSKRKPNKKAKGCQRGRKKRIGVFACVFVFVGVAQAGQKGEKKN